MPDRHGSFLQWWRQRRLRIHDLPSAVRALVWVSLGIAGLSAALIVAVGVGWEPWGGTQFAAFGGESPRFMIPWALGAFGLLTYAVVASTTMPGWRHPKAVRIAVGLGGAALAAQGVSMGWIISGGGVHAGLAGPLGWLGIAGSVFVSAVPQRVAERLPRVVAVAGAAPFLLTLIVWSTIGGAGTTLPGGPVISARDAYAQATITLIGAVAAAAGILVLWSLVLSTRQARDIGEGLADLHGRLPGVLGVLLALKTGWLIAAYTGVGFEATVVTSVDDGWTAWAVALGLVVVAGWWLSGRGTPPTSDYENREALRVIGFGYAAGPIAAVVVGLVAAIVAVLWTLEPSARLNDLLGWLIGAEPPVALWVVVAVSALTLVAAIVLWRRVPRPVGFVAAAVVGVWAAPRAVELTVRIVGFAQPFDAPSLVAVDTVVTGGVLLAAFLVWRGRPTGWDVEMLTIILAASTLIAHPLGIMPAGWQTGTPFYVLLVYPLAYTFGFDSVWLNGLDDTTRPGRVLRTVAVTSLLVVTTSMLVLLERVGPGFETAEAALLGAIGQAYLLFPAVTLAVAAAIRRRRTGVDDGSLGTQATRRWVWSSLTAKFPPGRRRT